MATDPICGMSVAPGPDALQLTRENRSYYFCSTACREQFAAPAEEARRLRRRLAVAWPLSIAVIVLTYGVSGRAPAVVAGTLAAVVQFYAGGPFYLGARDAIRHRIGNMDLLIAIGTTTAFVYSVAALSLPGRLPAAYYFDASSFIVTLILTGNYLEHLTRSRAGSAVRHLRELLPNEARVLREGAEVAIPLSDVQPGDRLRVRPGGRFPADGIVREGRTSVEESLLTGESTPVPKGPGDAVLAGSVNGDGVVVVETTGLGEDTFLAQVGQLLSEAEMARMPLQRTADRIASVFVPFVLAIAVGAAVAWVAWGGASPTVGILIFVTVAVTACPCAFGIATPAAILVGTGRAAEDGVLFRGEDAISRAATVDAVLTDKTGTLTVAAAETAAVWAVAPASEEDVVALAAGLEAASDHPIAAAVRAEASRRTIVARPVGEITVEPGAGLRGRLTGVPVAVLRADSSPDVARANEALDRWVASRAGLGETVVIVWSDGRPVGGIAFRAQLARGARPGVAALQAAGIEVGMVTGDSEAAARSVAAQLGIREVRARASPSEKVAAVRAWQAQGKRVAFVGDGVNDAAALAAADVGMAIGTGTEVAKEAGQVLLVRSDFSAVPYALAIARRTVGRVRANLTWALAYNAVLLPIAAGALLPLFGFGIYDWLPMAGALAMGLSSTTVVLNSLTLRRAHLELGRPGSARRFSAPKPAG
jgi:P-type Cu+ transporter